MYYYQRIRLERENQEISQGKIAEKLGIKQTQYSRYERGVNEIPLHYIIEVANILNVSIDYLTERTENKKMNI